MIAAALASDLSYVCGVLMLIGGACAAWTSTNLAKRLVGAIIAYLGALVTAAAVGAPTTLLIGAAALGFATSAVGAAIVIRLQEAHGTIEANDVDASDRQSTSKETAT